MYQEERDEIRYFYNNKEYMNCIKSIFNFLSILDRNNFFNNNYIFSCYFKLSVIYSRLDKFDLAIKYARKANLYCDKSEANKLILFWTFSFTYYRMNNIELSLDYIKKAIDIAMKLDNEDYVCQGNIHLSLLTNNEDLMIQSIERLKEMGTPDHRVDKFYEDAFNMYINMQQYEKALDALNQIKNKKDRASIFKEYLSVING